MTGIASANDGAITGWLTARRAFGIFATLAILAGFFLLHGEGPVGTQTFLGNTPCTSIAAFGGAGNNSTDNAPALTNALASFPSTGNGGCIFFPPGRYKFNSSVSFSMPSGIDSVGIIGGGQDNTVLTWPAATAGGAINITYLPSINTSSVHFRDLTFTTGVANGGIAVNLNSALDVASPGMPQSDFYRVTFRGDDGYAVRDYWSTAVQAMAVGYVNFDTAFVQGPSSELGTGFNLSGQVACAGPPSGTGYAVQYVISKSTFQNLSVGINYGNCVQGINIDQTNFTAVTTGINVPSSLNGVAQLVVANSQFNTINSTSAATGILIGTGVPALEIMNNLFLVNGATPVGVNITNTMNDGSIAQIIGNMFWNSNGPTNGAIGVAINNTSGLPHIVEGNIFRSFSGTGALAIALLARASNVDVVNNTFSDNGAASSVQNNGAGNTIVNNPGYNPVGVSSAAYAPASNATYTASASPETHYLTGGSVSAVKLPAGGATICTTTPCTLDLGPNETFSVTYTVPPTDTKSVH